MKRIFQLLLLSLFLTVASCTPAPGIPSTATAAAPATQTQAAAPATLAVSPTQTPLFPKADGPTHPLGETPTPIATPAVDASGFRLKKMDEASSAAWVKQIYEHAEGWYAPQVDDVWAKSEFSTALGPAELAIREHLMRFPDTKDLVQYRWLQLFIDAYAISPFAETGIEMDSWLIARIQAGLDDGSLTPQTIHSLLQPYRFRLELYHSTPNLFGDGQPAWLYQVGPSTWQVNRHASLDDEDDRDLFEGLFFVIRELQPGKYQVHLLHSAWGDNSNYFQEFTDHNQNGIPELYLQIGRHSGTMCGGSLLVYEWHETKFAELTQGQIATFDCGDSNHLTTEAGVPAVQRESWMGNVKFLWDGSAYELEKSERLVSLDNYTSLGLNTPEENILALNNLLTQADFKGRDPGLRDYLRFLLGIEYALAGKQPEAQRTFQSLIDEPSDQEHDAFPGLASRFVQFYQKNSDVYRACRSVNALYGEMSAPYPGDDIQVFYDETLGVSPGDSGMGSYLPICDDQRAAMALISFLPAETKDLSAALQAQGMSLSQAQKLDINQDGADEWILIYRDPFDFDVWLLAAPVNGFYQAYPIYQESMSIRPVSVLRWPSLSNPVLEIQTEDAYSLLEVFPDFSMEELYIEYDPGEALLLNEETQPVLQYIYRFPESENESGRTPSVPWSLTLWNPQTHAFDTDWVEYQLLTAHDPAPVLKLLPELLPYLDRWQTLESDYRSPLARQYYLAALAYELSGDETAAVQLYWQLWHDFPETPYALMAQLKLEAR